MKLCSALPCPLPALGDSSMKVFFGVQTEKGEFVDRYASYITGGVLDDKLYIASLQNGGVSVRY
jgi:hypothetical protein